MSLKPYGMDPKRLARHLKASRDNWRAKALEKQKKLRVVEQRIRDLEKSREQWKAKAKEAEKRIKELEKSRKKQNSSSPYQTLKPLRAYQHHYSIQTIQISLQQVIYGGSSYRSAQITMKLFKEDIEGASPHFSSIRNWIGRVGLYELYRPKEKREDWIFIVDLTLELGQEKALVVYGIPQEKFQKIIKEEKRSLTHKDGEILMLEVSQKATGEVIHEKLELLRTRVGIPRPILGDHGSNLKKGIQLYQKEHPQVIYTYDVTHAMSNLLKQELTQDESYPKFLKSCRECRLQLQQTELAFLAPPSQRSQCRYFNVERLVNWGKQLLRVPREVILKLMSPDERSVMAQKLEEKFLWLTDYRESLKRWEIMIVLTRTLEAQVKAEGFKRKGLENFEAEISDLKIPYSLWKFKEKIVEYISFETGKITTENSILATTDVVESLLGKYKNFSSRCPLKDLRQMLLTIPLSTLELTNDLVKKALESIQGIDLKDWVEQVFGLSMLSKRKTVFSATQNDIKSA
jgi:hypothetical protein